MAEEEQNRYRKAASYRIQSKSKSKSKSRISCIVSTLRPRSRNDDDECGSVSRKKKYIKLRGLGCTAPAQVSVPTMIKMSANWEGNKKLKKKNCIPVTSSSSCLAVPHVCCAPGIGYASSSVVSTTTTRNVSFSDAGKLDVQNMRGSYDGRRMVHPEELPFFVSDSGNPHHHLDVFGSRHHRHLRHHSPEGLAKIVILQSNSNTLLMGGRLDHDRYREWRLDVDSMSYEELLELGDKIGYVSTGLKEDEISRCVRRAKLPVVSEDKSSSPISTQMQWKCTICQEEYEEDDEIGKLGCGHFHHMYCIKQWLMHKKTCPICKVTVECQQ